MKYTAQNWAHNNYSINNNYWSYFLELVFSSKSCNSYNSVIYAFYSII